MMDRTVVIEPYVQREVERFVVARQQWLDIPGSGAEDLRQVARDRAWVVAVELAEALGLLDPATGVAPKDGR